MSSENLLSLELGLGALGLVLGLRLYSLVRVSGKLPDAEERIRQALDAGDATLVARALRRFGHRLPSEVVATDLLDALAEPNPSERTKALEGTARLLEARVRTSTSRAQALDLLAIALMVGVAAFSNNALPTTPAFWSLGGALLVLLIASFFVRRALATTVLSSLKRVTDLLRAEPELKAMPLGGDTCSFCGGLVTHVPMSVRDSRSGDEAEHVLARVCTKCDTVVFKRTPDDDASSATWSTP